MSNACLLVDATRWQLLGICITPAALLSCFSAAAGPLQALL
jgi:hypothetical protein